MKTAIAFLAAAMLLTATACNQSTPAKAENANSSNTAKTETAKPAANRAEEEKALKDADTAWSASAERKDLEALVGFVTDDTTMLPPNAPAAKGKDAVRREWTGLLGLKDVAVKWQAATVQVADSGELGYTSGTYTLSFTDPKAGKVDDKGKYLEVWKKVDGKWKCHMDMYSSDIAAK
jgi:ketosteroid isomerase-like protein